MTWGHEGFLESHACFSWEWGVREVGGPNSDLLSSPFLSPTYLVTPNGVHLLYLQELDSAANNRNDDHDDGDDDLNQCSSNHHVLVNHLWTCWSTDSDSKGPGQALKFSIPHKLLGVPVLLDHKAHWEVRASTRHKLIPHLGTEPLEADPPALGHHSSSIRGSNSELSVLPSSARGFHP